MKKVLAISFILLSSLIIQAQADTTQVEQYCQVIAPPRLLSNRVTIDIDFGEQKRFWQDTRLKTDSGNVRKFNTVIDALNYMGASGWIFINAYPVRKGENDIYHFAFKKLFPVSELH